MKNTRAHRDRLTYLTMRLNLVIIILIAFSGCQPEKEDTTEGEVLSVGRTELINHIGKDFLIDDQHSYIGFKIKYFGFSPVRGRFDNFDGTVFYDPSNLASLSVSLVIDVKSINTGVEMRDDDLQTDGPGWFNVKDFPQIHFTSNEVMAHKDSTFSLLGDLTMNGITKPVSAHFTHTTAMSRDSWANDQVDFSGTLTLNRQDFEVFGGDFWSSIMENGVTQLSDDVEIEIDIHTRRTNYLDRMATEDSSNIRVSIPELVNTQGISAGIQELKRLKNLPDSPVSSGAMSTIGYTLVAQNKLAEAKAVFLLRQEMYPGRVTSHDQLGIVSLIQGKFPEATNLFLLSASEDSTRSRPLEYLKLIDKIN